MRINVHGENPFQVNAHIFGISPSAEGYTLNYSDDGIHFTAWEKATPADTTETVVNAPEGRYYKLIGNQSDVIVRF